MSHNSFIHSSSDEHLGCFLTAMNIPVHILVFWDSSDIYPEMELLGSKAVPFFNF